MGMLFLSKARQRIRFQPDAASRVDLVPQRDCPTPSSVRIEFRTSATSAVVRLEDGLEGLLHISELSEDKIENAEDVVKVGDPLEVKILRVDTDERKIGLSKKRVGWSSDREAQEASDEA